VTHAVVASALIYRLIRAATLLAWTHRDEPGSLQRLRRVVPRGRTDQGLVRPVQSSAQLGRRPTILGAGPSTFFYPDCCLYLIPVADVANSRGFLSTRECIGKKGRRDLPRRRVLPARPCASRRRALSTSGRDANPWDSPSRQSINHGGAWIMREGLKIFCVGSGNGTDGAPAQRGVIGSRTHTEVEQDSHGAIPGIETAVQTGCKRTARDGAGQGITKPPSKSRRTTISRTNQHALRRGRMAPTQSKTVVPLAGYRGFESLPLRQLVACLCRESLSPEIVQTYPRLVPGVLSTIPLRERDRGSFWPMSAPLSPASAYAVPFARRDPKQLEGASLSTCSNSD
jgi:hypothetical protein